MKNIFIGILIGSLSLSLYFNFSAMENEPVSIVKKEAPIIEKDVELVAVPCKKEMTCTFNEGMAKADIKELTKNLNVKTEETVDVNKELRVADDVELADLFTEQAKGKFETIELQRETHKNAVRDSYWANSIETSLTDVLSKNNFFGNNFATTPNCKSSTCDFSFTPHRLEDGSIDNKEMFNLSIELARLPELQGLEISTHMNKETGEMNVLLVDNVKYESAKKL